jgi:hypothetical protein
MSRDIDGEATCAALMTDAPGSRRAAPRRQK